MNDPSWLAPRSRCGAVSRALFALVTLTSWTALTACADPCTDDGFAGKQKFDGCQLSASASASVSESTTEATATATTTTMSASLSASESESATMSGSESASASGSASATVTTSGAPGCDDGMQGGDETDIDCGGACGPTCDDGQGCEIDGDCISDLCEGGTCQPSPTCDNMMFDPGETDVDCGGVCGATCDAGLICVDAGDCISGYCDPNGSTCQPPSCADGAQNGDETDVDCGGACGPTCGTGQVCEVEGDCISMLCVADLCAPDPLCLNMLLDDGETDVDCGGVCGPTCEIGEGCLAGSDCISDFCGKGKTCDEPSCDDGAQNGDETDVDCGGACGATCEVGELCEVGGDCLSMACSDGGVCVAPECALVPDDNSCQACIKTSCCDSVTACLMDPGCTCWLECIEHNNDFMPCVETCMLKGKPGSITSCANSKCNTVSTCAKP